MLSLSNLYTSSKDAKPLSSRILRLRVKAFLASGLDTLVPILALDLILQNSIYIASIFTLSMVNYSTIQGVTVNNYLSDYKGLHV